MRRELLGLMVLGLLMPATQTGCRGGGGGLFNRHRHAEVVEVMPGYPFECGPSCGQPMVGQPMFGDPGMMEVAKPSDPMVETILPPPNLMVTPVMPATPGVVVTPAPATFQPINPAPAPTLTPTLKPSAPESPRGSPPSTLNLPANPPALTPVPPAPPGSLKVEVRGSKPIVEPGESFTYTITLRNEGGSAVESVELSATLSDNLDIQRVEPSGVATIQGNRVTFARLQAFTPMPVEYRIVVEPLGADGGTGRIAVEVNSPILSSPIREEAVTRIAER